MAPDTVVITGYALDGRPITRMEIPERWLTAEWLAWMETRLAREDRATGAVSKLKLLG